MVRATDDGLSARRARGAGDAGRVRRRITTVLVVTLGLFLLVAAGVREEVSLLVDLDEEVAEEVHDAVVDNDVAVEVTKDVTFLGSSAALFPAGGAVASWALVRRRPALAVFVVVVTLSGALLNRLVKALVDRERPSFPDPIAIGGGMSFPSGHAMNSMITLGAVVAVVWVLRRTWGPVVTAVMAAIVFAIGLTRIVLGVHYLSDVVGGWLLGTAWLALAGLLSVRTWRHAPA